MKEANGHEGSAVAREDGLRQLREDARRAQERLLVLSKVTQAFAAASQSPDKLFEVIVREIANTIQCTCALSLATADGVHFTTAHVHSTDPQVPPAFLAYLASDVPRPFAETPGINHVFRTGTPFRWPASASAAPGPSASEGSPAMQLAQAMRINSAFVVPVNLRGQIIGALGLSRHGDQATPLSEHDLSLVQTLAEHAALAIAAARLIEKSHRELVERQRMAARLNLLADASQAFSEATGDYDRLLSVIARRLSKVIGDLCAVGAVSEDGTVLETGSVHHHDPEIVALAHRLLAAHPIPVGKGLSGGVAASGEPVFVPRISVTDMAAAALPAYRELLKRVNVGSLIMVPMLCRGKVVGVSTLFRSGSENPYTEDDLRLARNVADHAALAITNARSYAAERAARAAAVAAHQALRESEAAHRLLFEASPLAVLVLDVETLRCLAVNDAALRLYGYDRGEFLGMDLSSLRVDGDRNAVVTALAALRNAETSGIARHRRKTGPSFLAEYTSRALTFGGRPARISVISDVTARRDAEEMRALLAAIVQSSTDAIVSNQDGIITSWNAAAERLFGYAAAEAIGHPLSLIVPAERLEEERTLQARVDGGERIEQHETLGRRKDGAIVPVSISLSPIVDNAGKVCGASKTARDLTAQHQAQQALRNAEEQLRQAQKMEAVGRLAGGIAHDFNNLLSVVLGYSQILLGDMAPTNPMRDALDEIHKAAVRASELTRQLLVFSRQEVIAPRLIDLNDILGRVDKMVRRILGEDIELALVPAPKLGLVLADPNNVEQVILNLVVNARDAMPTGGKLTIDTANVDLDEAYTRDHLGATAGPHVMVAVSDTGVGMDSATRARIFEPFFTTKDVGKGTGLGLSTVFGIVQQAGGSVWVYSEPSQGATFKVYFPRIEGVPEAAPKPAPVNLKGSETILLVEDQEQVRNVAHGILKRYGYRVLVAQSAAEALATAEAHPGPIHLLLTDVVMPKTSGSELAKRLGVTRPKTKVLFMSGYTDDSVVRHGVIQSGTAFLQKPFTPESMARRLREVLDS